jgi:flavin reductase (DIM6/NTAB) family NADH-FMN oxidoreductase RutF
MKQITTEDLAKMEQRYRASLINSLTGFKSVALIGTKNNEGQENLAIFNSLVHLGANPALIGMIVRPDSVERHTLENIESTGFYTINHILESFVEQAHHTAARYPRHVSEFEASGLTPEYKNEFFAPFVKESIVQIGMKLQTKLDISINNTIMVIGEIQWIKLPEEAIGNDGFIDLQITKSITNSGLDAYHRTERIVRLPYAKPKIVISQ